MKKKKKDFNVQGRNALIEELKSKSQTLGPNVILLIRTDTSKLVGNISDLIASISGMPIMLSDVRSFFTCKPLAEEKRALKHAKSFLEDSPEANASECY